MGEGTNLSIGKDHGKCGSDSQVSEFDIGTKSDGLLSGPEFLTNLGSQISSVCKWAFGQAQRCLVVEPSAARLEEEVLGAQQQSARVTCSTLRYR